jgi:hypothetical protein
VFSFFDFRSSFPVFPTSLKLRAKKLSGKFSIFTREASALFTENTKIYQNMLHYQISLDFATEFVEFSRK